MSPRDVAPARSTTEAESAARSVSLRYVHDDEPGLRRVGPKRRFAYVDGHGRPVRQAAALGRIRALAIPPAWRDVWICLSADGHIQATGRDARGRKQYRYHARWRAVRDEAKFEQLALFGRALPALRSRLAHDLHRPGLDRDKVVATIVALMEETSVRVGNDCYAAQNHSFGLTTLRDRHVRVSRGGVTFAFTGKSGKTHRVSVRDAKLAAIVKRCRDIPGQRLFQWLDADGARHPVTSNDVNDYFRAATRGPFTAKVMRTWIGTITAARVLATRPSGASARASKREVQRCLEIVSARLGNTPAIARKSYIHPRLVEDYVSGALPAAMRRATAHARKHPIAGLSVDEVALLSYLAHLDRAGMSASAA
jgi:DNA topoisomerase-1